MNRKQDLKQQYRDAPPRAGVYVLRNLVDGRVLVGGSMNVDGALNRHRFELRLRTHRHDQLSADWARHGEAGFAFEVLDRVKPSNAPDFDPAHELQVLLALWQQELCTESSGCYSFEGRLR